MYIYIYPNFWWWLHVIPSDSQFVGPSWPTLMVKGGQGALRAASRWVNAPRDCDIWEASSLFGSPVHPFKSFNLGRNSVDICWLEAVEVQQTNQRTNQPADSLAATRCLHAARRLLKGAVALSPRSAGRPVRFLGAHCILSHSIPNDWWSKWEGLNINKHHEKCIEMYQTCLNISEHEYQLPSHLSPAPPSVASCELPPGHVARPAAAAAPHRPVSMPGRWPGDPCWS